MPRFAACTFTNIGDFQIVLTKGVSIAIHTDFVAYAKPT